MNDNNILIIVIITMLIIVILLLRTLSFIFGVPELHLIKHMSMKQKKCFPALFQDLHLFPAPFFFEADQGLENSVFFRFFLDENRRHAHVHLLYISIQERQYFRGKKGRSEGGGWFHLEGVSTVLGEGEQDSHLTTKTGVTCLWWGRWGGEGEEVMR